MGSKRTRADGSRRRFVAIGIALGVTAGIVAGAIVLAPAGPEPNPPLPRVLHAAPALVEAGADVGLVAGTACDRPETDSCSVVRALAHVLPDGSATWTNVVGVTGPGAIRFDVPGSLVPDGGFSYWLELRTAGGEHVDYPPAGSRSAIRVVTTAGLPTRTLPALRWKDTAQPAATIVTMPYGDGAGEAGTWGGKPGQDLLGPSSFDVGKDGSIYVADWANRRIEVFSARGRFERELPTPDERPVDVAVAPDGRLFLSTLGEGATAYEVGVDGTVLGRYPVTYGIPARVSASPDGPRVLVGPSQWAAIRVTAGIPLSREGQASEQTTSIPLADGSIGLSGELDRSRIAFVWTTSAGSRIGSVVTLPRGVRAGTDYFVRPLADGGALAARGLWNDHHYVVGLLRFDPVGDIASFSILPEPSVQQEARYSTVRFADASDVLVVFADDRAVTIDRFEVT